MATTVPAGQPESGADFRAKFEALQAANEQLTQVSRNLAASAYPHVRPEDFEGIDPAKYVEHAAQVHNTRVQERESLFAEIAKERGIDVSALSQANAQATAQETAQHRIASVGELRGTPPATPPPGTGLSGRAALAAYYASQG